jgi:hypothetical protein
MEMQNNPPAGESLELDTPEPVAGVGLAARGGSRAWLVPIAMAIMALGFLMMFQPFVKLLFTYSFIVILFGTLMFIIVSHLSE